MQRLAQALLILAAAQIPSAVISEPLDIVMVYSPVHEATDFDIQEMYEKIRNDLESDLSFLGVHITDAVDLGLTAYQFSPLDLRAFQEFGIPQLVENDYALLISITAKSTRLEVARSVEVSAEGMVIDLGTGVLLTTFSADAPERAILPLSPSECNTACIDQKMAEVTDNLSRELSFVLSQKVHFLQEDGLLPSVSIRSQVSEALDPSLGTATIKNVIISDGHYYAIDNTRSLSLDVYFDSNSHELNEVAQSHLAELGIALSKAELASSRYLIIGHTDVAGEAESNLILSEKRAQSVMEFLITEFGIDPDRLMAIGMGESRLKIPSEPYSVANRRVEISLLIDDGAQQNDWTDFTEYTLTFNLIARNDATQIVRMFEQEIGTATELILATITQRVYRFESDVDAQEAESALMQAVEAAGVSLNSVRVVVAGTNLTIEAL